MGDGEAPLPFVKWPFLLSSKPGSGAESTVVTGLTSGGKKNKMF